MPNLHVGDVELRKEVIPWARPYPFACVLGVPARGSRTRNRESGGGMGWR